MKRKASVTWSGSAREGRGTFRVGSGALTAPFTYNSRFVGDTQTNPEELLLTALAGCLTMATASALQTQLGVLGDLETTAELDLVPHESGGYRIPKMRLEILVEPDRPQDELDRALGSAMEMCPICNALTGSEITVSIRSGAGIG
ncbi:MAG TPA: OsmC family peroxiredoxin [Candidatus Dormibacteraeota bacterium]|nr:OsmC family peroxiredoxin [Candidatus Dormibacteraeota bacterium]